MSYKEEKKTVYPRHEPTWGTPFGPREETIRIYEGTVVLIQQAWINSGLGDDRKNGIYLTLERNGQFVEVWLRNLTMIEAKELLTNNEVRVTIPAGRNYCGIEAVEVLKSNHTLATEKPP